MHFQLPALILSLVTSSLAASSWTFSDGTFGVSSKSEPEASKKLQFSPGSAASGTVSLSAKETLKVLLTTKESNSAKRPHQAFLLLTDPSSKLEAFLPLVVSDSGKAKIQITHKDIPSQLLAASSPLELSLVLGSSGSSTPSTEQVGTLTPVLDESTRAGFPATPLRYGKLDEIHHVFRAEPRNPPKIITLVFLAGVLVQLPILFVVWLSLSANVSALPTALSNAPLSHPVFFVSLLALEGLFFAYYTTITLFQTLAVAAVIGPVAFLSGSRALREVRLRRLEGKR